MTLHSFSKILTILFCLTNVLVSCGQSPDDKSRARVKIRSINNHKIDTLTTAVIAFGQGGYPFDNASKPTNLTEDDINNIDSLIVECVSGYNDSLGKEHKAWSIDLNKRNYKKQLIAVTNKNGEKEVWINCFCQTSDDRWKTNIRLVEDGGNCFFNFKVNLTTKKFFGLSVNGVA